MTELYNKKASTYGKTLQLYGAGSGLTVFHDIKNIAHKIQDEDMAKLSPGETTDLWAADRDYELEMSYETAEAVKQKLLPDDQQAFQEIIDEAKAWGNKSVILEMF